jgi:hypothetical protein
MLTTFRPQSDLTDGRRADPQYWHPGYEGLFDTCRRPLRPLGDFITHLAYGPIVTGAEPPDHEGGVALLNQGQLVRSGVDPTGARLIPPGCRWDGPRARVREGDLLLARSGVASVARGRMAVFLGDYEAVVGSFVDLVRVEGIEPLYALAYLRSEFGWAQMHRIINGVGTPNVSFGEIRGLQVAMLSEAEQAAVRGQYLESVHGPHLKALRARQRAHLKDAERYFGRARLSLAGIVRTVEAAIRYG